MPFRGRNPKNIGFDGGALPGEAGFGVLLGSEGRAETGRAGLRGGGVDGCFGGGCDGGGKEDDKGGLEKSSSSEADTAGLTVVPGCVTAAAACPAPRTGGGSGHCRCRMSERANIMYRPDVTFADEKKTNREWQKRSRTNQLVPL